MGKAKVKKNGKPSRNGKLPEVLTLAEAAAWLRVTEQGLHDAAVMGSVPGRFIGVEWRFSRDGLREWFSGTAGRVPAREIRDKGAQTKGLSGTVDPGPGNGAFRAMIGSDEMDDDFVRILERIRLDANRQTAGAA